MIQNPHVSLKISFMMHVNLSEILLLFTCQSRAYDMLRNLDITCTVAHTDSGQVGYKLCLVP